MHPVIIGFIVVIGLISYKGLEDQLFFGKYKFNIYQILEGKQYLRMVSSGFLHGSWTHLIFNLIAFASFGEIVLLTYGLNWFIQLFFLSLLAGNFLSLFLHKDEPNYSAIGASGAVSGLVFSAIIIAPSSSIYVFFIPYGFPAWFVGTIFVIYSIYGLKRNLGNIGHDAHLGGAIMGLILSAYIQPQSLVDKWWVYLLLGVPSIGFLLMLIKNPRYLF
ncbi:rhomboid family intramembrane serine protease [Persicobacter psychrovividus]|uniref:Rhomboid family intramembrane serine protease n=1 Tax=Persicobacter psychrovividus TaxID=387638 RepID=A0ABN6LBV3_9BACT|nr:rhomboid family intramembrane serine protease [Persicobacter psychrovividus]